jgi:hypothetical protein
MQAFTRWILRRGPLAAGNCALAVVAVAVVVLSSLLLEQYRAEDSPVVLATPLATIAIVVWEALDTILLC